MNSRTMKWNMKRLKLMFILPICIALLFSACTSNPPKEEREAAERAFLSAKPAEKCAALSYTSAEKALMKARRLTTEKNYEDARHYFVVAEGLSKKALKEAQANEECMNPKPVQVEQDDETQGGEDLGSASPFADPDYELTMVRFPFNSEELTEDSRSILQNHAQWMKEHEGTRVVIEGHCDSRGSTEYNLALGERRSHAVRKFMVMLGVDPDDLQVMSYGEERPLDSSETEEAWEKNRRAEFRKR